MFGDMEVHVCTLLDNHEYVLKIKIYFVWNLLNSLIGLVINLIHTGTTEVTTLKIIFHSSLRKLVKTLASHTENAECNDF